MYYIYMYDVCMCVWHISGEVAQKGSRQMAIFFSPSARHWSTCNRGQASAATKEMATWRTPLNQ